MESKIENSMTAKVVALVCISVVLWLVLGSVLGLGEQRGNTRDEATAALARSWTGPQTLAGPVIILPYTESWTSYVPTVAGDPAPVTQTRAVFRFVYPEHLSLDGRLLPQERSRGIYRTQFYQLDGRLEGSFDGERLRSLLDNPTPEDDAGGSPKKTYKLSGDPMLAFAISDLRGVRGGLALTVAGQPLALSKTLPKTPGLPNGVYAALPPALLQQLQAGGAVDWKMTLQLSGQKSFAVLPVADVSRVHLASPWPHPSFGGQFLPGERTVTEKGFDATWQISGLSGPTRSQFESSRKEAADSGSPPIVDALEVRLIEPLDVYALSTRATKYGLLFVVLTLAAVFAFEVFSRLQLHPIQYGLVGLAIALFFLLLLALSEKIAFGVAYLVAASGSVMLLGVYFAAVLRSVKRALSLSVGVALMYGALYVLLMSEDNALLLGSLLLFGVLAAFMVGTRRIDWYALGGSKPHAAGGATAAQPAAPWPSD